MEPRAEAFFLVYAAGCLLGDEAWCRCQACRDRKKASGGAARGGVSGGGGRLGVGAGRDGGALVAVNYDPPITLTRPQLVSTAGALLPRDKMLVVADGAQAVQAGLLVVKRVSWVNHPNPEKVLRDLVPPPIGEKSNRISLIIVPLPLRFATLLTSSARLFVNSETFFHHLQSQFIFKPPAKPR